MSFMDKMRDLVGIDYDDDMDITQEEIDNYKKNMGAQAAAPQTEEKSSAGITPLGFGGVEPPMTAMPKASPDIKDSMNQSGPFKMVVIEPKSLESSSTSKELRQILPARCSISSAEQPMLCPEQYRESTRTSIFLLLRTLTSRLW